MNIEYVEQTTSGAVSRDFRCALAVIGYLRDYDIIVSRLLPLDIRFLDCIEIHEYAN